MEKQPGIHHDAELGVLEKETLSTTVLDRVLIIVSTILFVIMLALVLLQVFTRYITAYVGISFPWTEEFAGYLLTITTFLGGAIALARREHVTITTAVARLPLRLRWILDTISHLLIFYFLLLCIRGSRVMMGRTWRSPVGALTTLKVGHLYLATLIGLIIMLIYSIRWIVKKFGQAPQVWSR
ncbi:MAG: TRAP transporter small permease [Firmicutes bacterium]|nr:TRAP transporter small permease [Bacillota bacterium]